MRVAFLAAMVLALDSTVAIAQPAPARPAYERPAVGALAAVGLPGPVAALRGSAPLAEKFGIDLDLGVAREAGTRGSAFAAQVRWLHGGRKASGSSGYVVLGLLTMNATTRTEIRFPGETVIRQDRRKVVGGQLGYGWDWQTSRGIRAGVEIAQGGAEGVYRLFVKTFVVWGPQR